MQQYHRHLLHLLQMSLLMAAAASPLYSAITIYPEVLYSGMNVITVNSSDGLSRIEWFDRGRWRPLRTGSNRGRYRIMAGAVFGRCAQEASFTIQVTAISRGFAIPIRVTDCDDDSEEFDLRLVQPWNVYREEFDPLEPGEQACHTFEVDPSAGGSLVIDSITSPSPLFSIRYTGRRPPLLIRDVYTYQVCFTAGRPGLVRRPIFVYVRRDQPAGGYTNFIVADTAYALVVASTSPPPAPRPTRPARPPRGHVIMPPPVILTPEPPPIPEVTRVDQLPAPRVALSPSMRPIKPSSPPDESPQPLPRFLTDPTTFRVLLMPTAKSLGSGTIFLANYDIAGWVVGYGATERLSLLGGFVFVPGVIDYNLVASIGGKYELLHDGQLRIAAGAQFSFSQTPLSSITLGAPYAVASLGNEDKRLSLLAGYSWRHHQPVAGASFDRTALLLGLGGDYRLGFHWKVVGELFVLENSDVQPLSLTARYFSDLFSVDAGVLVNVDPAGDGFRIAPVVNGVWVW